MSETTPPRTNLERELVRIWEQVLQRVAHRDTGELLRPGRHIRSGGFASSLESKKLFISGCHSPSFLARPPLSNLLCPLLPGKSRDRKAFVVPIQSGGEKPIFFCVGEGVLWRRCIGTSGTGPASLQRRVGARCD